MTDKNNLPATTTTKGTIPAVPPQPGNLMARGLAAIRVRPPAPVSVRVDSREEDAFEYGARIETDDAADYWKRGETVDAIDWAIGWAEMGYHRAQELLGAIYSLCPEDKIRDYVQAYVWYSVAIEHMAGTEYWWKIDEVVKSRDWVAGMLSPPQLAEAHQLVADWAPTPGWVSAYGAPETPLTPCEIGDSYSTGSYMIKNSSLAVKWWLKAAEQGSNLAQHQLGKAFTNGIGVPEDLVAAHAWFSIAWENELKTVLPNPSSDEHRILLACLMTNEQLAQARRRADDWMERHGKQHLAP